MDQLEYSELFILYFIRDCSNGLDGVKRRDIGERFPRLDNKQKILYRLDKMRHMGLIKRRESAERTQGGVEPTYEYLPVEDRIEEYEDEYRELPVPPYKWQGFTDEYFKPFEKRLKAVEREVYSDGNSGS